MKRIVSLALALALVLCLFAAPAATADDQKTFTIVSVRHTLDKSDSLADKAAPKMAEEKTGVHIEWIELTAGTETERVNIMLAGGDLPDAFLGALSSDQLVKNLESFVILDDYISEAYMPNYFAMYEKYPKLYDFTRQTDGHIYSLATGAYASPDDDGGSIQFINVKWLGELGLEKPTTTDEYYAMLVAAKATDLNHNGEADEIPMIFSQANWAAKIIKFAGPWGFTNYYKVEDGKFIFTPTLPEFRSFLEFYAKCAAEGLMTIEGFTNTNQQYYADLKSYKGITYAGWTPQSNYDTETAAEFEQLPPMQASGYEGVIAPVSDAAYGRIFASATGLAVTTACADVEGLLAWVDAQNADLYTKYIWRFGEPGNCWEMREDGTVWTIYPDTTEDYTRENMKYSEGFFSLKSPCLILPEEFEQDDGELYPQSVLRITMVREREAYAPAETLSALTQRPVDADKVSERTLIETDLNAYLDNFVAESIVYGIDDAKWEAHLAAVESYGASAYVQWYQDFLDGKF